MTAASLEIGGFFTENSRRFVQRCVFEMPVIHRNALLPYSCEAMYALVNDVAAYPQFMAGCRVAEVLQSDAASMLARLELKKGGVSLGFTTRNRLDAPKVIDMELVDGPFSDFAGRWFFQFLREDACKIHFDLRFEVTNKALGLAASRLLEAAANNLVDELCKRANKVYGRA